MTDIWMGDDFFHNGAFRETYGFDYVQEMEAQKTDGVVSAKEGQYNFFLDHVNFAGPGLRGRLARRGGHECGDDLGRRSGGNTGYG